MELKNVMWRNLEEIIRKNDTNFKNETEINMVLGLVKSGFDAGYSAKSLEMINDKNINKAIKENLCQDSTQAD